MMNKFAVLLVIAIVYPFCGHSQDYSTEKDVVYREGSPRCALDISYIKGKENRPVIVWFHGGGLTRMEKFTPAEFLASDYVVVAAEYRLYPEVAVKDIIDDAALAVSWIVNHIQEYGGSESKIYLAGHSAGAYLVSMIGLDKNYLGKYGVDPDKFAAIVPFSGQMMTHFTEKRSRGIEKTRPVIDEMAPLYHIRADAAPILLITGDRDLEMIRRYEENAYFYEMMKYIGHKDIELYELEGFNHGGMVAPGYLLLMNYIKKREKSK